MFPGWRGGCAPEFPDRGIGREIAQRAWSSQLGFGFLLYQKELLSRVICSILRQKLGMKFNYYIGAIVVCQNL